MQRERLTDDIYIFTSEQYAQATASVIFTVEGAVLIDTLVYPEETRAIKRFIEQRMNARVRYVVNTHYHADHTTGTCLFPDALVIGHQRCAELLDTRGRESFAIAKRSTPEMHEMYLMLPQLTFGGAGGSMTLTIGRKTLQFWHTPGHSADSIVCYAKEDNILFAADTVMPLPYFVDGNYDDFLASLSQLRQQPYESIVQGHGDVVLRGEVDGKLNEDINYLKRLRVAVDRQLEQAAQQRWDASTLERALATIDLESCGKSRVLLNGLGQQLHRRNVQVLVAQRRDIFQLTAE